MIGNSNNETNFPHKLLLTDTHVSKIRKISSNRSSANIKLSQTQLSKMMQSGGLILISHHDLMNTIEIVYKTANKEKDLSSKVSLDQLIKTADIFRFFPYFKCILGTGITLTNSEIKCIIKEIRSLENRGILLKGTNRKVTSQEVRFLNFLKPLMTAGLSFNKNVFTPLAKSILIPLGLTTAASAKDAVIQNEIYRSGTTTLIISNEEMEDIMKTVESLEESKRRICRNVIRNISC